MAKALVEMLNEVYASPEARFAYDGANDIEYVGKNDTLGAATSRADWFISKITWQGAGVNKVIVRIQKQIGAWDDRATLGW